MLSGVSYTAGIWVTCILSWFWFPLNVQLQVFDLEAAVGPGLLVVVDLQSVCIASEGNCLGTRCGCEACWLIPFSGVEDACLIGLLSDDFGHVRKGTPDDVMNLDFRFWSGIEGRSTERGGLHFGSDADVVGLQAMDWTRPSIAWLGCKCCKQAHIYSKALSYCSGVRGLMQWKTAVLTLGFFCSIDDPDFEILQRKCSLLAVQPCCRVNSDGHFASTCWSAADTVDGGLAAKEGAVFAGFWYIC
ncbi:hypothetical protein Nepgr_013556 [Nepenthes gracilis]|uniref:Uncharacterized protein n=1 Tax=Nepenthes gracilis TaxID=150966 RepID=A0AAD3XPI6_NEPGR|nr:hypothetical protein Nepgr_013556 [Nepenthes gracilis]